MCAGIGFRMKATLPMPFITNVPIVAAIVTASCLAFRRPTRLEREWGVASLDNQDHPRPSAARQS